MAELPNLFILQIKNEKIECSVMIIMFCEKRTQNTTNKRKHMAVICSKISLWPN